MFSLGTVFHALAAVVLGWLVLALVRMQADRDFVRALFASRVTVDWMGPYLKRFCRVWGVPFEYRGPAKFGDPARRHGRALMDLHFHHGLIGVRIDPTPGQATVSLRLRQPPQDAEAVLRQLREALAWHAIQFET